MQFSCERDALVRGLAICAGLCRVFPEIFHTILHARTTEAASIDMFLWNEANGVGVLATVPATITEAGSITVPTRLTTSALAAMPQSRLHLSSIIIPDRASVSREKLNKPLKGGPVLQIEGTSGTGATQRTRLRLCTPTSEHAISPALADWQASGVPLATIAPNALRKALEPCLLLAKEREGAAEDTPDMDHALVLFRFDPRALSCTATTRSAVGQSILPWTRSSGDAPSTHALVDERMLRWIMTALKRETHPVTLTLVPQEASATLLLFSLPHLTLVCRGKTAPIPLVWEQRIGAPSTHALLLSRSLLMKALDFLSADHVGDVDPDVLVNVADHRLCLQWNPLAQPDRAAMCWLPLVNTVADTLPVLVHLPSMRRIIRLLKGPAICLEIGAVMVRQKKGEIQIMMTIAEHSPPPSADPAPAHVPETPAEGEKGAALATA